VSHRSTEAPTASHSSDHPLLRGLNPAQAAAVTSDANPLRILAGAGSGKTRALTHRIAHQAAEGLADPTRTLAVTFTRKAAGELRTRLDRLGLRGGVRAGTFHAIAYAQLRQRWEERGVRPPELLERKVGFVARLVRSRVRTLPLDVVAEIEWAAARMVDPDAYPIEAVRAHRRPPLEPEEVADIYRRYRDAKRERRLVDFDDLLRLAARDLTVDPVYAQARRWRFRHLYVDEFQDVNPLQHHLLSEWLGPESTLCVVGDPNQAIYAWNGADARFLVDFDRWFPGGDTVTLADNYRSTPEILAAANGVLSAGPSRLLRLRANRASGRVPEVQAHPDEVAEARAVARRCRDRRRPGDPWRSQAVLVRTNAQAAVMAEAFTAAGVPFRVRGAASLLEQPEVRQALDLLRRCESVAAFLSDVERELRLAPGTEGMEPAWSADEDPAGPSLTDDRRANLAELVRLGREHLALDPTGDTAAFAAWLRSTLLTEDSSGTDAVDVVTFHAAKGLEWPVVHVAGLEKGFVPIHHAEDDSEALDEERRLLYVALTRARDELWCTWAERRAFGSRSLRRTPSPWIDAIRAASGSATDVEEPGERARTARQAKAARRRPQAVGESDKPLFESLRAWRRSRAAGADVPAFVIFNDATLQQVAQHRPTTRAELMEISGIGAVKAERFGDELLRLVADDRAEEPSGG
jgi:DNA helicase-2/ATP-dependent DNA helicase PcrA